MALIPSFPTVMQVFMVQTHPRSAVWQTQVEEVSGWRSLTVTCETSQHWGTKLGPLGCVCGCQEWPQHKQLVMKAQNAVSFRTQSAASGCYCALHQEVAGPGCSCLPTDPLLMLCLSLHGILKLFQELQHLVQQTSSLWCIHGKQIAGAQQFIKELSLVA